MSDEECDYVDLDEEIEKLAIHSGNENKTRDTIVIEEISLEPESDETKYKKYLLVKNDMNELKCIDLREKINVTKNILDGCQSEVHNLLDLSNSSMVDKLKYYTKLPEIYLKSVCSETRTDRSFTKVINDIRKFPNNVLHFVYNDVREIFIYFYVEKKKLPTIVDFFKKLNELRNLPYYTKLTIRGLVKNGLVDFHYFPRINSYILSENPRFGYKRTLYLKQMENNRRAERKIVYVAIKKIENKNDQHESYFAIAATPLTGLISKFDAIDLGDHKIKQWIQSDLLRQIPPETVVVLTQPAIKGKITPFSTKEEMMKWLDQNDIPFEKNDHKAMLYNLVKIHKKKYKDKGLYEDIFKSFGLEVVLCPNEYEALEFFGDIHKNIRTSVLNAKLMLENTFSSVAMMTSEDWMNMELKIIEKETEIMREDNEMEKIVENILQMVKHGKVTRGDFPGVSATKEDNFDVHIGDIFVD